MITEYQNLMEAAKLLAETRREIGREDGMSVTSPAWRMVAHAARYVEEQAEELLRAE